MQSTSDGFRLTALFPGEPDLFGGLALLKTRIDGQHAGLFEINGHPTTLCKLSRANPQHSAPAGHRLSRKFVLGSSPAVHWDTGFLCEYSVFRHGGRYRFREKSP
jgi:hypothetical protein